MIFRGLRAFLGSVTGAAPAGVGVLCLLSVLTAEAQTIQITAPASGTVVAPGATVSVSVSLGSGANVSQMIILGENPIGLSNPLTAAPFQFSIAIPISINAGSYNLTADATGPQGQDLQSAPIAIDVEPSVGITSVQVQPGIIRFRFVGDSLPVTALGTLATGGQMDLTNSTLISYTSSSTAVATVSQTGVVTAVGPGSAFITVSGPSTPFAIPVFATSTIRGDLNGDGEVDVDDLNILNSALNTSANGSNDARDLNHDGVINALDAEILITLCTHPECSVTAPGPSFNPCDLKLNGNVNVSDAQLVVNEALGLTEAVDDLNGDSAVNIVDLQIEINGARGLGCKA